MATKGLDTLVSEGEKLLKGHEPVYTHKDFEYWIKHVSAWLNENYPDSGLSAQWLGLGFSLLVTGNSYSNDQATWIHFKSVVAERMKWLGKLAAVFHTSKPSVVQEEAQAAGRKEIKLQLTSRAYVDPERIKDLDQISDSKFDLSKLIRLCEELNICFAAECYLSMIILTRAILDHIPPIFGVGSFKELANNYGESGKSFKDQMQYLENSSRKIADGYLHQQIRASETLPTVTQIDFSNSIDCLLSEIIRSLRSKNAS